MKLGDWLKKHRITQDAFGLRPAINLTQGRISQIVADGTNDLATALAIERETGGEVTVNELALQKKAATLQPTGREAA